MCAFIVILVCKIYRDMPRSQTENRDLDKSLVAHLSETNGHLELCLGRVLVNLSCKQPSLQDTCGGV